MINTSYKTQRENPLHQILAILVCVVMMAFLLMPLPVSAQEAAGAATVNQYVQEYTFAEGEPIVIPQVISQFGREYHLISQTDPVPEAGLPETRTYTYRVSGALSPGQLAEVQAIGNVTLTPVASSYTYQVERDENLINLANNDIDELPQYKQYSELSATSPGTTVSGNLKLAEAEFSVAGKDALGLPDNYSSHVVYRGAETASYIAYYTGEATFRRSVEEDGERIYVVIATYESEAEEIAAPAVPLSAVPGVEAPLANVDDTRAPLTTFQKVLIAAGSVVLAFIIALILWLLLGKKKKKRKYAEEPAAAKGEPVFTQTEDGRIVDSEGNIYQKVDNL